jgi:hypothetical protein
MNELVHFSHGRGDLLLTSVGATVVLAILLNGTLGLSRLSMLGGDKNGVDLGRGDRSISMLVVGNGNLGLTIGTEPPESSILADISELLSKLVSKKMGQRHAALSFIRGVTKHNTLVTSTNIKFVLSNVHTTGDIGGLLVDTDKDLAGIAGKSLGFHGGKIINKGGESDLTDLLTNDGFVVKLSGSGNLTENHNHVILGCGFAGNLGHRIGLEAGIKNGVRDLIAELVRVSLVDGLRGEKERACFNHGCKMKNRSDG